MSALKLNQVSLYALPAIRYAIAPSRLTDQQKQERIVEYICKKYKLNEPILKGRDRKYEVVFARHLAMYAIREKTNLSLVTIGKQFSKDHTTVISAITSIKNYITTNEAKAAEIQTILDNCLL